MAAVASVVWDNVAMEGSNVEVTSANQYFKVSGKTLFRRLIIVVSFIFLFGAGVLYGSYTSLKRWDQEQTIQRGIDTLRTRVLPRAFHDSAGRFPKTYRYYCYMYVAEGSTGAPSCHPGTRVNILDQIQTWSNCTPSSSESCPPVFWLHSPYPMGKSAIAQTASEKWFAKGQLAASYMLSPESVAGDEQVLVVPTLAYQLMLAFGPRYRSTLGTTILSDPSILTRSMKSQVNLLIRQPLIQSLVGDADAPLWLRIVRWFNRSPASVPDLSKPKVIVIDGLDSVLGAFQQYELLESLGYLVVKNSPHLRLFISSRPSGPIHETFYSLMNSSQITTQMELKNDREMTTDIEFYIRSEFARIRQDRGIEDSWPSEDTIKRMVKNYQGQFISANYAMACIASSNCNPKLVLNECLLVTLRLPHPPPEPDAEIPEDPATPQEAQIPLTLL